jgi:hypothetical protein
MQTFQLFSASPDYVMGIYVFSVVDYTGKAQFIEVSLGGVVVERRSLILSGSADFTLYKGLTYSINVISLESGVFSQLFTAGNIYSTNIVLLANSFGEAPISVERADYLGVVRSENNSVISLMFDSPDHTGQFNFTILKNVGTSSIEVYTGSVLGAYLPFNFVWDSAEPLSDYTVLGFRYNSAGVLTKSWSINVPLRADKSNPWAALLAPFNNAIGTFPNTRVIPAEFDWAQLPATCIIALVLAIFSWKNHALGCILAWVIAAVLVALGWFVVSLPAFGFALFTTILLVFVEGKRTEREL